VQRVAKGGCSRWCRRLQSQVREDVLDDQRLQVRSNDLQPAPNLSAPSDG
jgi:hypothetical protein